METLSFQAPAEMKKRLETYAQQLDRSKAYLIREAISEYLDDVDDYLAARQRKAEYDPADNVTIAELKRIYRLDE